MGAKRPDRQQLNAAEEQALSQTKVVPIKKLPKYMQDFAQEVAEGKHTKSDKKIG